MHRRELIISAARSLDKAKMIRFEERTQFMFATDVGRTASNFYIKYDTVEVRAHTTILLIYCYTLELTKLVQIFSTWSLNKNTKAYCEILMAMQISNIVECLSCNNVKNKFPLVLLDNQ